MTLWNVCDKKKHCCHCSSALRGHFSQPFPGKKTLEPSYLLNKLPHRTMAEPTEQAELPADFMGQVESHLVAMSGGNDKAMQEGAYRLWMLAVSKVTR